jgi:hypothetical protein
VHVAAAWAPDTVAAMTAPVERTPGGAAAAVPLLGTGGAAGDDPAASPDPAAGTAEIDLADISPAAKGHPHLDPVSGLSVEVIAGDQLPAIVDDDGIAVSPLTAGDLSHLTEPRAVLDLGVGIPRLSAAELAAAGVPRGDWTETTDLSTRDLLTGSGRTRTLLKIALGGVMAALFAPFLVLLISLLHSLS